MSLFLNPRGTDLVLLAEDERRCIQLGHLEMQYYRALLQEPALHDHLRPPDERIRYGQSCRDVTRNLSQELVALAAAIGTRALRLTASSREAAIRIWRVDEETCRVNAISIEPLAGFSVALGEWTLHYDEWVIARLMALRQAKLPNETGGVLVGAFDLERKHVYLVDTVPSPPDSIEWPILYIRGSKGLGPRVEQILKATAQELQYVGEWHSHPDGYTCSPSDDDLTVFTWLTDLMDADGLPSLMIIVGEGRLAPFLGQMQRGEHTELTLPQSR